jgi:hypothetical protein
MRIAVRAASDTIKSTAGRASDAAKLLLPALNQMIDITTTRTMAEQVHRPAVLFVMLFGVAQINALLAGYAIAARSIRVGYTKFVEPR